MKTQYSKAARHQRLKEDLKTVLKEPRGKKTGYP